MSDKSNPLYITLPQNLSQDLPQDLSQDLSQDYFYLYEDKNENIDASLYNIKNKIEIIRNHLVLIESQFYKMTNNLDKNSAQLVVKKIY